MNVKLLTEHNLEFQSLKGGYTGWSQSTLVKMPHCWKSRVTTHIMFAHLLSLDRSCLILYVPSAILQLYRDGSSWVEPVLS